MPHPDNTFDFAISVASVHHLSTKERRIDAIGAILRTLRQSIDANVPVQHGGQVLIFVWALEQKNSRRGWDEGHEQDVLVPWIKAAEKDPHRKMLEDRETYQRYYYLYRQGELEEDVISAGGRVVTTGYDKDNWWVVAERFTDTA